VAKKYSIVENSNALGEKYGWHLNAINGSGTCLPFADSFFDCVISCSVLEHVGGFEEQMKVFKESYRVLKEGGMFALTFDFGNFYILKRKRYFHRCIKNSKEIKTLIERSGFKIIGNSDFENEEIDYGSPDVQRWEASEKMRLRKDIQKGLRQFTRWLLGERRSHHLWYTAFSLFLEKGDKHQQAI